MNIVLIILGALLILFLIVSAIWGNGEKNYRLSPEVLRIFDVIIVLLIFGIVVISFSVRQKHIEAEKDLAEQQEEVSVSNNESVPVLRLMTSQSTILLRMMMSAVRLLM